MAIVGGALIPLAQGRLADMIGLHHAFILPAICYLYSYFLRVQRVEACSSKAAGPSGTYGRPSHPQPYRASSSE